MAFVIRFLFPSYDSTGTRQNERKEVTACSRYAVLSSVFFRVVFRGEQTNEWMNRIPSRVHRVTGFSVLWCRNSCKRFHCHRRRRRRRVWDWEIAENGPSKRICMLCGAVAASQLEEWLNEWVKMEMSDNKIDCKRIIWFSSERMWCVSTVTVKQRLWWN